MSRRISVLHIDDDPHDRMLVRGALEAEDGEFSLVQASSRREFEQALARGGLDVVVTDLNILEFSGLDVLTEVRKVAPSVPVIVVTGTGSETLAVEALRHGAAEYVIKTVTHILRLPITIRNVLERRRLELEHERAVEALRRSESQLRLAVSAGRIGIRDWSFESEHMEWNSHHAEIFGLPLEEFDGKYESFARRVHPDDIEHVDDVLSNSRGAGVPYSLEYRVSASDGSEHWVLDKGSVARDEGGRPARMTSVVMDISELKRLRDNLQQSQKLESIGRLAAGVAHDFNNVLTAIFGYLDVAMSHLEENREAGRALEGLRRAAEQAAGITRALLTFARQARAEKRVVDIGKVLEESARLLEHSIPASIGLEIRRPEEPVTVMADRTQIQQVIMNLALNAVDAMPNGGRLRISLHREKAVDRSGLGLAVLSVSDSGPGISPDVLDRLFEPFVTSKPRGEGTGLGLSICHGIVTEHGGEIEARTTPGKGASFTVRLPCVAAGRIESSTAPEAEPSRGNGELILVAEDQANVRELIVSWLTSLGYRVAAFATGIDAMAAYQRLRNELRLAMLDKVLPGIGGIDCLRQIRACDQNLPVIVMSGSDPIEIAEETLPGVSVLRKPFQLNYLAQLVAHAIREPAGA